MNSSCADTDLSTESKSVPVCKPRWGVVKHASTVCLGEEKLWSRFCNLIAYKMGFSEEYTICSNNGVGVT